MPIALFDIVGPIIVQSVARSHGASLTAALALSGIPPAAWILVGMVWRGRVDAVGVFVLSSIILATLIGLATGSGRLYLLDGAILTGGMDVCLRAEGEAARGEGGGRRQNRGELPGAGRPIGSAARGVRLRTARRGRGG